MGLRSEGRQNGGTMQKLLRKFKPDKKKMKALIQYICWKGWKDHGRGVTLPELKQALFECDMTAYAELGRPITGYEYYREPDEQKR